jgi:succinoglycan biosynthesis protein ExoA
MVGTGAGKREIHTDVLAEADGNGGVVVSVLTPVLNEAASIRATVAAMRAQDFAGRLEYILVDGGSDDATPEILQDLASSDERIRLLENPHREVAPALNIGLRAARGRYVARMDAHALYPPGYLSTGVRRLDQGDVEWVSGPQIPHGTDDWSRRVELALRSPLGVGGSPFRRALTAEIETDGAFTGMWRRETLDRLDGWNEAWIVNEDGELAARLRGAGGRIVCVPEMASRYVPRRSVRALARQYWRYGQYRAKTCLRYPRTMRRSHALPPAVVFTAALAVVRLPLLTRAARLGIAAYVAVLIAGSAQLAPHARPRTDAAWLPLLLATMHLSWGAGFLVGCARFGPSRAEGRSG